MRDSDIYAAHAARCRAEADAAMLDNVRERCLRAEAAWAQMADRSRKTEAARLARAATAPPSLTQEMQPLVTV